MAATITTLIRISPTLSLSTSRSKIYQTPRFLSPFLIPTTTKTTSSSSLTFSFSSRNNNPNNPETEAAGAVIKGNIAYIGWDIFTAYARHGHVFFKELFTYTAERLMGDDFTAKAEIPDRAVMTYTRQNDKNRSLMHLLFAHTTVRGKGTEVIEDTVPLYNVKCTVKADKKPSSVRLVPSGEGIDFTYADGKAEFTVPKVDIHQMIEIAD